MGKIMDALKVVTPLIREFMLVDTIVELVDYHTQTVVAIAPGKILDFNIRVGDPVSPGGVAEAALLTGKQQILERDSSAFGKPYVAVATPIYEEGSLVGVLTVGYSTAQREQLQEMAQNLLSFIKQFSTTMDEVSSTAEDMARSSSEIIKETETIARQVKETGKIINFVKDISRKTQILGINASIEAARVGIQGRGFTVVAEEIQKLANHTQESAKSIEATLDSVQNVYTSVNRDLDLTHNWTESQRKAMQELNKEMDKLARLAEQLLNISKLVHM